MGQKKTVHIYRMVSGGTAEERVVQRAQKKLYLSETVRCCCCCCVLPIVVCCCLLPLPLPLQLLLPPPPPPLLLATCCCLSLPLPLQLLQLLLLPAACRVPPAATTLCHDNNYDCRSTAADSSLTTRLRSSRAPR